MHIRGNDKGIFNRCIWQPLIVICALWLPLEPPTGSAAVSLAPPHSAHATEASARVGNLQRYIGTASDVSDGAKMTIKRLLDRFDLNLSQKPVNGKMLFVLMILIAAATLISEDMTCIGAGFMVAQGTLALAPAVLAAFIGIFAGDMLLFLAGRHIGKPLLRYPPFKWMVKTEDLERATHWFDAKGPMIIISSRFLPGSRLPTYFAAGLLGTGIWLFTGYFSLAAALWTPALVGLAAVLGSQMLVYYHMLYQYGLWVVLGACFLLWLAVKLLVPIFSFRGRRLLLSALRRKTRWEFWSPYLFYLPVIAYVAFLAVRHRSLTVFTAANPGIPESGFLNESKSQILDRLQSQRHLIARYHRIDQSVPVPLKLAAAEAFMQSAGIDYPVVLKPDFGQRGAGVVIVYNRQETMSYLAQSRRDTIIQEFVPGFEFGIFYVRHPDQPNGHIFSITEKQPLSVTGDGEQTLEHLILADDLAVNMAPFHLRQHRRHLYEIPPAGVEIKLVEIGTHCRGAIFKNGVDIHTAELEKTIDRISKGFEGFYFGRYDIRTASIDDLKRGCNFKVVELNGVTSEATHIYQRGTSLWQAYAVLMQQWRTAYDIGTANARNGSPKASVFKLSRMLFQKTAPAPELPKL